MTMMITKKTFWIPLVAVTVAVSAAACGSAEPDPLVEADAAQLSVKVDAAVMTTLPQTFEAGGALVARQTAVLSSRILALVLRVNVSPGDRVRRGQALIEFDGADIAGRAAGATSALASAQASARAAESERTAAESAVTLARATHDRIARLQKERSATPQELDQAVAALRQAEARLAAITAQLVQWMIVCGLPDELLRTGLRVVHDELDLPTGQMKLKHGGGHAGHNGLRDIQAQLGSPDFWRLRLGIGHPGVKAEVIHYVLRKPPASERDAIDPCIESSITQLPLLLVGRMDQAMIALNARPAKPGGTSPA